MNSRMFLSKLAKCLGPMRIRFSEVTLYIPMGPIRMPENYFFDRFALRGTLGGLNGKNRHF